MRDAMYQAEEILLLDFITPTGLDSVKNFNMSR